MKTTLLIPLLLFVFSCAATPRPAHDMPVLNVSPGSNPYEISVGVHNADTQLGEALFSVTLTWPDGTETLAFNRQALHSAREYLDGHHHPDVNITVLVRAAELPTTVTYQDHLRDRRHVIEISRTTRYQTAAFFVSPGGVGTIYRTSTSPSEHNPWNGGILED